MADTGILLIVAIVILSGKLGYAWRPQKKNLEFALYAFMGALAVGALGVISDGKFMTHLVRFLHPAANAAGAFFVVMAAFGIAGGGKSDEAKD